jgi:formylglycine-generating enzyme required for sulfatase activity
MVRVETGTGPVCVHRYEVSIQLKVEQPGMIRQYIHRPDLLKLVSAPGQYPSIVSWNEASRLCHHFGYRMCTSTEWQDICDGVPGEGGHPYAVIDNPDAYVPGACVFTHTQQGGMVPLQRTGSMPWCVTPTGVHDLLGNVWEWTDPGLPREGGKSVTDKRGGAHYSRELATCSQSSVGTHGPDWLGSVGFRCCATPGG